MTGSDPISLALSKIPGGMQVAEGVVVSFISKLVSICNGDVTKAAQGARRIGEFLANRLYYSPAIFTTTPGSINNSQRADLEKGSFPATLLLEPEKLLHPNIAERLRTNIPISQINSVLGEFIKLILPGNKDAIILTGPNSAALLESQEFNPLIYMDRTRTIPQKEAVDYLKSYLLGTKTPQSQTWRAEILDNKVSIVTILNNWIKLQQVQN